MANASTKEVADYLIWFSHQHERSPLESKTPKATYYAQAGICPFMRNLYSTSASKRAMARSCLRFMERSRSGLGSR